MRFLLITAAIANAAPAAAKPDVPPPGWETSLKSDGCSIILKKDGYSFGFLKIVRSSKTTKSVYVHNSKWKHIANGSEFVMKMKQGNHGRTVKYNGLSMGDSMFLTMVGQNEWLREVPNLVSKDIPLNMTPDIAGSETLAIAIDSKEVKQAWKWFEKC